MKKITKLKLTLMRNEVTQKRLSELAEMSEGTVSMIVNRVMIPTFEQKQRIANALGLSEKNLFADHD